MLLDFRSLSTFSVHIVEQLCKNLETAMTAAYWPLDDKALSVSDSVRARSPAASDCPTIYPANYVVEVYQQCYQYFLKEKSFDINLPLSF